MSKRKLANLFVLVLLVSSFGSVLPVNAETSKPTTSTPVSTESAFLDIDFEGNPFYGLQVVGKGEQGIEIGTTANPNGGNMLKIVDMQSPNSALVAKSFEKQTGSVTFEFDLMADKTEKFGPSIYFKSKSGVTITTIGISNLGFNAYNGASSSSLKLITPNEIFKAKVVFDFNQKNYSVYINDEEIATELSFRNEASDVSRIEITTPVKSSSNVVGYLDNIKGYKTVPPVVIEGLVKISPLLPTDAFKLESYTDGIFLSPNCEIAYVNGKEKTIDPNNKAVAPFIFNSRTFVPVRFIAESLGATVTYDDNSRTANITLGNTKIALPLNSEEIFVNGQKKKIDVASMEVESRIFVPLRAIAENFNKKVGYDSAGLVTISNNKEFTKEEMFKIKNKIISKGEKTSADKYSAVYLSSRAYRTPDAFQTGTIDAIRQFNPTTIRWAYIREPAQIQSIAKLGVKLETAVQDTLAPDPIARTKAKNRNSEDFEGNPIVVGHIASAPNIACYNGSTYINGVLEQIKISMENGVIALQHDDWVGNISLYNDSYGCFCEDCLKKFNEYIKEKYSVDEIKAFGIDDINNFNYRTYLQTKFSFKTNQDYKSNRSKVSLDKVFKDFQYNSSFKYFMLLKEKAKEYSGGKDIPLNGNMGHMPIWYDKELFKIGYAFFNEALGETDEEEYQDIADLITGTNFVIGTGKTYTISPRTSRVALETEINRRAAAVSYALGNYFLVPWDVWLSRQPQRAYGTTEQYGDLFSFIRQYPELFDKHEAKSKVAIAVQWSELSDANMRKTFKDLSYKLFQSGVSYKVVVANNEEPTIKFNNESFDGINEIITIHSLDKFSNENKQFIEKSGINITSIDKVSDAMLNNYSRVKVSGGSDLYATIRETSMGEKAVHIINYKAEKAKNVVVNIKDLGSRDVILYRPGFNPTILRAINNNVTIPLVDEWAIIKISNEDIANKLWSTYDVGMPSYTSSVAIAGNDVSLNTNAPGFNFKTSKLDTATGDYLAFTYKTVEEMDFVASAKIDKTSLTNGGTTGIIGRDSISSNSSFVAIAFNQKDGYSFIYRDKYNKDCVKQSINAVGDYVKLEKASDVVKAFVSEDNVNWKEVGSKKIAFSRILVGAFLTSDGNAVAGCKINNLDIKEKPSAAKISSISFTAEDTIIPILGESKTTVDIKLDNSEKAKLSNSIIEYKSSNEKVMTIDQRGLITGLAEGEATITVKATFGASVMEKSFNIVCSNKVTIIDENFDDQQIGSASRSWQQYNNTKEAQATIEMVPERNSKGIRLNDIGTGVLNVKLPFVKPRKGVLTFEFDYFKEKQTVKSDSLTCYIYANSVPSINLAVKSQNFVWEADNKVLVPFEDGKWYKVQIVCDIPNQTADVYINNKLVGKDLKYKGPVESVNMVMLGAGTGVPTEVTYFDNFKVYSGRPE